MRLIRPVLVLFAAIGLLLPTGCLTQRQVKKIVAESNAAMLGPYLDLPGADGESGWQQLVRQLDEMIEAHADEPTLANHLRVRQAMLLTVHGKDDLATSVWGKIPDGGALQTERDRLLYAAWKSLVWSYRRLPLDGPISPAQAQLPLDGLAEVQQQATSDDLRGYFATIRAQIDLKVANGLDETRDRRKVEERLAQGLKTYVDSFSAADRQWLKSGEALDDAALAITDFRRRVWLRAVAEAYRDEADNTLVEDESGEPVKIRPSWDLTWLPDDWER